MPSHTQRFLSIALLCVVVAVMPGNVAANDRWRGDFESGDTSQWSSQLNPAGLSVVSGCARDGKYAGKVSLTGASEFLWNGNPQLNRSEFHHRVRAGDTAEGKETFFGFSFYLPKAFAASKHEFAYWESDKTWKQAFRFNISGTELGFQKSAATAPFWVLPDGAAPGRWHDVALHIRWSSEASNGAVRVWVDGRDMGEHHFSTLPDREAQMFTQIGILRSQQEAVEEMLVDAAFEAGSRSELLERQAMAATAQDDCS